MIFVLISKICCGKGERAEEGQGQLRKCVKENRTEGESKVHTNTKLKCGIEMKIVLENDLITDQCNL